MSIIDCFTFNNELDVLEIRLRELSPVVDRFVLVEAAVSHTGLPKPLFFAENRSRYSAWADRIVHVVLPELPESKDPWVRENAQREAIAAHVASLGDRDHIIISDVDEIPRADAISEAAADPEVMIAGLRLAHFYLRLNYLQISGRDPVFVWPVLARGRAFKRLGPQGLRDLRIKIEQRHRAGTLAKGYAVLEHAGWHFSYLGNDDHVSLKLKSFAHQELVQPELLERFGVAGIVERRLDMFGRADCKWIAVRLNDFFPKAVLQNQTAFAPLLVPDPDYEIDVEASRAAGKIGVRPLEASNRFGSAKTAS